MSSHTASSVEAQNNITKRVCKACDRCRLKKSKCNGASPCSRCKADDSICMYGERRKLQNKLYPKGYVEMLEKQQAQLVAGLRELYSRLQNGQCWPGQPLREAQGGRSLTHDILERLNLLHSPNNNGGNYEGFEDDCNQMQQKLLERGAPFICRNEPVSSDSDHVHTPTPSSYGRKLAMESFSDLFARNNPPPMSLMNSPITRQSPIMFPATQESPMVSSRLISTGAFDPSSFSGTVCSNDSVMMDELVDFSRPTYGLEDFGSYNQSITMVDPIVINLDDAMMPD